MSKSKSQPKPRIRQNIWGNWYGYLGNRRVIAFSGPEVIMQMDAEAWLAKQLITWNKPRKRETK